MLRADGPVRIAQLLEVFRQRRGAFLHPRHELSENRRTWQRSRGTDVDVGVDCPDLAGELNGSS